MSLFTSLNIGKQALYAAQTGILVTSNNISNVSTEGYTRQQAVFESISYGGVTVGSIDRIANSFVSSSLRDSISDSSAAETLYGQLYQLETILSETDDSGLSLAIEDFFTAIEELTTNPSGSSERSAVASEAEQLIAAYQSIASNIESMCESIDNEVSSQVDTANSIIEEIASINESIQKYYNQDDTASQMAYNQLLDQRDQLIVNLSEIIPVNVVEEDDGGFTLFGAGEALITGTSTRELFVSSNSDNNGYLDIYVGQDGGISSLISDDLSSGSLSGLIEARDEYAGETLDGINRMAAQLVRDFNAIHTQGTGLDGVTGRNFFEGLDATAQIGNGNTGGVSVDSAVISDESLLDFDDYEIRFTDDAGSYEVVDTTTGTTVTSGTYTSGGTISFNGIDVTLSDSGTGPLTGDVILVDSYSGTIDNMTLNSDIADDASAIAAGATSASGDNEIALQLVELGDTDCMGVNGNYTYTEFYNQIRVKVGLAVESAETQVADAETVQTQLEAMWESVSGVSTDEEAANLIVYQRAYQAASQVITTVDEMLASLLSMI